MERPPRPSTDPSAAASLPKNFLRPCVLLLLGEQPSHGYDLVERLLPLGFARDDPGRLYRTLRGLEAEGLVESTWVRSAVGPARRTYRITPAGERELHHAMGALTETQEILETFLCRCEEHEHPHGSHEHASRPGQSPGSTPGA